MVIRDIDINNLKVDKEVLIKEINRLQKRVVELEKMLEKAISNNETKEEKKPAKNNSKPNNCIS